MIVSPVLTSVLPPGSIGRRSVTFSWCISSTKDFYNPERIIISSSLKNKNNSCHFIRCFSLQIRPKTLISCASKGILCPETPVSEGLLTARL